MIIFRSNALHLTMNFLAHLYLSGSSEQVAIGNFIGDFVKGTSFSTFPEEIRKGIRLHRQIDSFTDQHEAMREARKRLWDGYRHYGGVITDLFNDHFLASSWDSYHHHSLPEFARKMYTLMQDNSHQLPDPARNMLPYMINGNWLVSYREIEGIDRALTGLSRRTRFESHMENAAAELESDYEFFRECFRVFFPDLVSMVTEINPYFRLPDLK